MSQEEREHKGCVINGTYQEVYCYKTVTNITECQPLAQYKLNDQKQLDFASYYNSYVWDIGRADQYHHYSASTCTITNSKCVMVLNKDSAPYNPYVAVLEKPNSDEVFFSDEFSISAVELFSHDAIYDCESNDCDIQTNVSIIAELGLDPPNQITFHIQPEYGYPIPPSSIPIHEEGLFSRIFSWFLSLFGF
jgi:hypothetical protein